MIWPYCVSVNFLNHYSFIAVSPYLHALFSWLNIHLNFAKKRNLTRVIDAKMFLKTQFFKILTYYTFKLCLLNLIIFVLFNN